MDNEDKYPGLADWQSVKIVQAGEITEVVESGCYVKDASGGSVLLTFSENMTARYQPHVGDFWVIYEDGYQALSPRAAFVGGYIPFVHGA